MSLSFVPLHELERIRALEVAPTERAAAFADACRINTLTMVAHAGSGHLGTSFSCLDILSWLHLEVLGETDRYFSSKGHDAPALYAVLIGLGRLPFESLFTLRRLGGLPGHPDVLAVPEIVTNTGSLGMGVSKARGFVLADRLSGRTGSVIVLTGDGELQEGQFWESLQPTANRGLGEITVIVDHNKLQSDTWVSQVSDLGDLQAKVSAFGWATSTCDGNDVGSLAEALGGLRASAPDRPKLLVAHTLKGAGVSFMEPHDLPVADTSLYRYHSGAPSEEDYGKALDELRARLDRRLEQANAVAVELGTAPSRSRPVQGRAERLVSAHGAELVELAESEPRLVALDADLRLDTGLVSFRERYPERFYECGIAEQDMVSQAGAMALAGLIPVVHSFACFLSTRPCEQIFNNASEGTKVVYVGSLAGIVPGGPGHSHQSVRDAALFGSVPGMTVLEPTWEDEAREALRWAVLEAAGPVYIRLVSVPWEVGCDPPPRAPIVPGRGTVLRDGRDGAFVATGPVTVSQAWAACDALAVDGIAFGLIALPWLTGIDGAWLWSVIGSGPIVTLDNHVLPGGLGSAVLAALSADRSSTPADVIRIGVEKLPVCGTNDEVIRAHGLDADTLARRVLEAVQGM
jgi:transketolase